MDQPMKKPDFDYDNYGLERRLDSESTQNAAGYWFLAAVLFAFIAAGIIVYRAGNAEMQTAANYSSHPAAQSDPVTAPPIVPR
jgi:cbb3-type cytochrome oxidase subunit 3